VEKKDMLNQIWEQFGEFLNRLRCENLKRYTAVEIPRYRDTQMEVENLREQCEITLQRMGLESKRLIFEWMSKIEDMNSLEGQKAYCQGYVDCILLLSGLGLLRCDLSSEELMKMVEQ